MKSRKWFITINPQAECYSEIMTILDEVRCKNYVMIYHDAEEGENDRHIHLCIEFDNARHFDAMVKRFKGAHVEVCTYWNRSIQYLVHKNDPQKKQYEYDDLISSYSKDELLGYLMLDEFEKLNTENLLIAIKEGQIKDIFDAVELWGINQVSTKYNLIMKMLEIWNIRKMKGDD